MTVSTVLSRADFPCNGVTTVFPFTFPVAQATDLIGLLTDPSGNVTTLAQNSDYTVTINGTSGGSATTSQTYASGYTFSIKQVIPLTQPTSIRNQGAFFPEIHEAVFDRLTKIDQQQQEQLGRAIVLPDSIPNPGQFPTPISGSILGWVSGAWAWVSGASVSLAVNLLTEAAGMGTSLINYLAPFVGSVGRLLNLKLAEQPSVFDFMTPAQIADVQARTLLLDVTTPIRAAIAATIGGELQFPPGSYLIGTGINTDNVAALSFKTNTHYRGLGSCSMAPVPGGTVTSLGACLVWGGGDHGTMVDVVNTWGSRIDGISLIGNYDGNTHTSSNLVGFDIYTLAGQSITSSQNFLTDFSVQKCQYGVAFGHALGSNHSAGNMDGWQVERFRIDNCNSGFYFNSSNIYYAEIRTGLIGYFGAGIWFDYSGMVRVVNVVGYGMKADGYGTNGMFKINNNSGQLIFEGCQHQPSGYETSSYTFATFSGTTKYTPTTFIGNNIESPVNIGAPQTALTFIGNEIPSPIYLAPAAAGSNVASINDHQYAGNGFSVGGFAGATVTLSGSSMTLTAAPLISPAYTGAPLIGAIVTGSVQYVYGTGIPANTKIVSLTSGVANTPGAVYLLSNPVSTVTTPEIITGTCDNYAGINLDVSQGDGHGVWTPQIYQGTTLVGSGVGTWCRKGKLVFVRANFNSSSIVGGSGTWQIKNLPFTSDIIGVPALLSAGNITINGTVYSFNTPYWWSVGDGQTVALLQGTQASTVWSSASLNMQMAGTYQVP